MSDIQNDSKKRPPQPAGHWLLGNLPDFRTDAIRLFLNATEEHGDIIRLRLFNREAWLLRHPEHIRYVLHSNYKNFSKNTRGIQYISHILGQGLLTSDGDHWLRQRRIAQPAFHRKRLVGFVETMTQCAEGMVEEWAQYDRDAIVDLGDEMTRVTLRIAGLTLFSSDVSGNASAIFDAMHECMQLTLHRIGKAITPPVHWPTPKNRRFDRARAMLDETVYGLIEERRKTEERPPDLLSMLMDARDEESGEQMNNKQLRDEALTLLLAGHETTANALTWTWYLLTQNPEPAAKMREELDRVLDGRLPTLEDLPNLVYTTQVAREGLRMMPPGWVFGRSPIEADEIGGYPVAPGTLVMMSSFTTHRHPEFWEEPERFMPERFANDAHKDLHPFAYFPFGGGPRKCIGHGFAMMEMQVILAALAQRFEMTLKPGYSPSFEQLITLRPLEGMPVTISPRSLSC